MTGGQFADPNREAVGLEPAWAEGSGGSDTSAGGGPPPEQEDQQQPEQEQGSKLDDMTKDELLGYAHQHGVKADQQMTKADIRKAIDKA